MPHPAPRTPHPAPRTFPTLGILGAGQLGRMTALAAIRMGLQVRFLAPKPEGAAEGLGTLTVGDWTDLDVLRAFAAQCDAVTLESEWAPADRLQPVLPETTALWPSPHTVNIIRDKGRQKTVLQEAGLPVPDFILCTTLDEALTAANTYGYPVVLKRRRGSYDGYGNATVHTPETLAEAFNALTDTDGLLVEAWVPFVRELATLVARRADGEHVIYPIVHTEQRDHRCHAVVAPAPVTSDVAERAATLAEAAVTAIDGVGITGVEVFELADGTLLINELAPRPHNTGHYTIEGCYTSQFENHVRAVLGWPLGNPALREPVAVMVNVLGHRNGQPSLSGYTQALAVPGIGVHVYGKSEVRPKRKMGHVTATGTDPDETRHRAEQAAAYIRL